MCMKIHTIDVNDVNGKPQFGDCFLIEVEGKFILVDGGVHQAGRKVRDYLDKIDVNTLELVIVTHIHSDHVDGIISSILREGEEENRVNIDQVWAPNPRYLAPIVPLREALSALTVDFEDPNYAQFDSPGLSTRSIVSYNTFEGLLSQRGIPIAYPMADVAAKPQTLGISNFSIEVLGPSQEMLNTVLRRLKQIKGKEMKLITDSERARLAGHSLKKMDMELRRLYDDENDAINNTSLIVKITYKQTSFLFTGDAEIASLVTKEGGKLPYKMRKALQKKMLNVSMFKAPHHGSVNGIDTDGKILDQLVKPKNVVITAKAKDPDHPPFKLLEKLRERRIPYYLTTRNRDGIVITTDGLTELDFGKAEEGGDNPGT